ncbi:MAG: hypothetical protein WBI17_05305 [Clostridiaceae bacterium]
MNQDSLMYLQTKLNKDSIKYTFRKKLFGGLNPDDVIKYVTGIEDDFLKIEQKLRKDMSELSDSRRSLVMEFENFKSSTFQDKKSLEESLKESQENLTSYMDECSQLNSELQRMNSSENSEVLQMKNGMTQMQDVINQAFEKISTLENEIMRLSEEKNELILKLSDTELEIQQIKGFASEIEKESNNYKLRINELENAPAAIMMDQAELDRIQNEFEVKIMAEKTGNETLELSLNSANEKIEALEARISEIMMKVEEQKVLAAKAEQELKLEKALVSSYKINGFKNEFANLYQQLDYLSDEQVRTNNELQEKLEIEKTKASRAELKMVELMKCVKGLNEKLSSEQCLFNEQFSQLARSHSQFTEEVNEIFASLNEFEVKEMQHINL